MTRSSVDLPLPLGPMSATMPPPGDGQVDAVEDRQPARRRDAGTASRTPSHAASAAHGRVIGPERPQDRRDGRVQRRVGREQPVVGGRRARAVARARGRCGSSPGSRPRRPARAPTATAPRIAEPRTAVSSTAGTSTRKPVTSALIWFQVSLRAGPPQARIAVDRARPAASIGVGDVADGQRARLEDRPGEVAAAVGQGQAGEHARSRSGPRSASARRRGTAGRPGRRRRAAWPRPPRGAARSWSRRRRRRRGTSRAPGRSRPSPPRRCTARPAAPASRRRPATSTGSCQYTPNPPAEPPGS